MVFITNKLIMLNNYSYFKIDKKIKYINLV